MCVRVCVLCYPEVLVLNKGWIVYSKEPSLPQSAERFLFSFIWQQRKEKEWIMINKLVGGPLVIILWNFVRGWLFLTHIPLTLILYTCFWLETLLWPLFLNQFDSLHVNSDSAFSEMYLLTVNIFFLFFYHFNLAIRSSETAFCRFSWVIT